MKSVIHIVVDAYCYNNLLRKVGKLETTPFLNKLALESINFSNMYSQAPYTEASLVTILSGENTLDSGGYLFGNGTTETSIFKPYKEKGYKTIFLYSPYVYSKAYLRDVDEYLYSRFYSIENLYNYRLKYYREKYLNNKFSENDLKVCYILLEEGLETWLKQCNDIINATPECDAIKGWFRDVNIYIEIKDVLVSEIEELKRNPKTYIEGVFENWDGHIIRKENKRFVKRKEIVNKSSWIKKYQEKLEGYQSVYSNIAKKQKIDLKYCVGMFSREKTGRIKKAKDLVKAYKDHYYNQDIKTYLTKLDEDYKNEVSFNCVLDNFYERIKKCDTTNQNYYAYIHVQDFHLPSVFHSVDNENEELLDMEFNKAFEMLDELDSTYEGNIMADLSARYCDYQIELFFKHLSKELKNDFVFVVTADHGYPSYDNPPRPIVYNQTYTEAFHIPCIIYDGRHSKCHEEYYSNMDVCEFINLCSGITSQDIPESRKYILHEYGGPGCPDISAKPIWYTYMDSEYSVSLECSLLDSVDYDKVKSIYCLKTDFMQKFNNVKKMHYNDSIATIIQIISKRHKELQEKYAGDKFLPSQFDKLKY